MKTNKAVHFFSAILVLASFIFPFDTLQAKEMRIVALSPHLTELVYELGRGNELVGVSDFSDYPEQAQALPRIASYQGANIAEIIRLEPTHILVWKGGNKDSDVLKLSDYAERSHAQIFMSQIDSVDSLLEEISLIAEFLNISTKANALMLNLKASISDAENAVSSPMSAYYYMGISPLYGLGNDPWLNSLLSICGIKNKNASSATAYMNIDKKVILRDQPDILIAGDKLPLSQHESFWQPHREFLTSPIFTVNPDAMHRFTPRAIYETINLCKKLGDETP